MMREEELSRRIVCWFPPPQHLKMSENPSSTSLPPSQSTRPRPRPLGTTGSTPTANQMLPPRSVPPTAVSGLFTANSSLNSSTAGVSVASDLLSDDADLYASFPSPIGRSPGFPAVNPLATRTTSFRPPPPLLDSLSLGAAATSGLERSQLPPSLNQPQQNRSRRPLLRPICGKTEPLSPGRPHPSPLVSCPNRPRPRKWLLNPPLRRQHPQQPRPLVVEEGNQDEVAVPSRERRDRSRHKGVRQGRRRAAITAGGTRRGNRTA